MKKQTDKHSATDKGASYTERIERLNEWRYSKVLSRYLSDTINMESEKEHHYQKITLYQGFCRALPKEGFLVYPTMSQFLKYVEYWMIVNDLGFHSHVMDYYSHKPIHFYSVSAIKEKGTGKERGFDSFKTLAKEYAETLVNSLSDERVRHYLKEFFFVVEMDKWDNNPEKLKSSTYSILFDNESTNPLDRIDLEITDGDGKLHKFWVQREEIGSLVNIISSVLKSEKK